MFVCVVVGGVACDKLNLTFIKRQCTSVATRAQPSDWKHKVLQEAAFQQDRAQAWSQITSAQHHLCGFHGSGVCRDQALDEEKLQRTMSFNMFPFGDRLQVIGVSTDADADG